MWAAKIPKTTKRSLLNDLFYFQGSHNIVYLCLEDKSKLLNGGFYRDGKVEQKENTKLDSMSDVGEKLWTLSEKLCQLK